MSEPAMKRRRVDVYQSNRPQREYRSVDQPFSVLPPRLVLGILRERYILKVYVDRFNCAMSAKQPTSSCNISKFLHPESCMNQSDYFGRFKKDPTRTCFQLFSSLSASVWMDPMDYPSTASWVLRFEANPHLYFPHDIRYLKDRAIDRLTQPILDVVLTRFASRLEHLQVLVLNRDAVNPTHEVTMGGLSLLPGPFNSLERCVFPFGGYPMCGLQSAYPKCHISTLQMLPNDCKLQFLCDDYKAGPRVAYKLREWDTEQIKKKHPNCAYGISKWYRRLLEVAPIDMRDRVGRIEVIFQHEYAVYLQWEHDHA